MTETIRLTVPYRVVNVKQWSYYSDESVWIHPLSGDAYKTKTFNITWDETKTTIISAKLYGKIFSAGGTNARIVFNNQDKVFCDATFGDATVEDTVDVSIVNGPNTVMINVWKEPYLPIEKIGYFTVLLTIEFVGETPKVEPPIEDLLPLLILVSAIGITGIFAAGYLMQSLKT